MRKYTRRHRPNRGSSPNPSAPPPVDLADWRRRVRPRILRELVDQTRSLPWSRRLITMLLEELHVSDEFLNQVESNDYPDPEHYPQLVAIALLLRHSWFPDDLSDATVWLGLPSTLLTEPTLASSLQSSAADAAAAAGRCHRRASPART
jgi:hypothetical protein